MSTFYDRYQAGEHEQVWSELIALGDAVRHEPVYADAVAVARETMRRAQSNIETLIDRLHALGCQFDTRQRSAERNVAKMDALRGSMARQLETYETGQFPTGFADQLKNVLVPALKRMGNPSAAQAAAKPLPDNPREDPSVYCGATEEAINQIASAERRLKGPLPI